MFAAPRGRVGVVVSWDLGVIIASLGNVFDASMGVGVLRVATSSFEQFAQDGLQVDVRQATRYCNAHPFVGHKKSKGMLFLSLLS